MNKILHLNSNYADAFYEEFFDSLTKKGFKNTVFVPQKIGFDDCPNAKGVIKSPCYTKFDRFFLKKKAKKIFNSLEKQVDLEDIELIHAHSLYTCGVPALYCFLKYGIPYAVSVRYNDVTDFPKYNPGHKGLIKKVLENAKAIVFITPLIQRIARKKFDFLNNSPLSEKSFVIPNKVSDCFLNNAQPKEIVNADSLNILFIGRMVKTKRLTLLCKHCSKLFNRNEKLSVVSNSKNVPEKIINKYKFINYVGPVPHFDLPDVYRNADIFVLLSKKETFGISYIESMAQGTPIIWAKNEAIDGMFDYGSVGYGVDAKNFNDFREKVALIVENYKDMSKHCIEESKQFRSETIVEKWVQLYLK